MRSLVVMTALGTLFAPGALQAAPHVYADLVTGLDNLDECIESARKAANTNGFTADQEVVQQSPKSRDFYAGHRDKSVSMTVSCSSHLKGAAIAVAGDDNDETFELFRRVYKDF